MGGGLGTELENEECCSSQQFTIEHRTVHPLALFYGVIARAWVKLLWVPGGHLSNCFSGNVARNSNSAAVTVLISIVYGAIRKHGSLHCTIYVQLSVIACTSVHFRTYFVLKWQIL